MYAGIDEAGRGPVLGPLVVAGVACPDPQALQELGVKDSKKLSPARRVRLDRLIRDTPGVQVALRTMEAAALDDRGRLSMNDVEVRLFLEIAQELGAPHVTVDAADVNAERFGRRIAAGLPTSTVVLSQHKADDHHPVVAAASIVAKVHRDAAIAKLARRLQRRLPLEMGSGYSHDPRTRAFLAAWLETHGDLPEGTRRSWKPARTLVALHETPKLDAFAASMGPAGEQPTATQPTATQPTATPPTATQPTAKQTTAKRLTAKAPPAKQPAAQQPTADRLAAQQPPAEQRGAGTRQRARRRAATTS